MTISIPFSIRDQKLDFKCSLYKRTFSGRAGLFVPVLEAFSARFRADYDQQWSHLANQLLTDSKAVIEFVYLGIAHGERGVVDRTVEDVQMAHTNYPE